LQLKNPAVRAAGFFYGRFKPIFCRPHTQLQHRQQPQESHSSEEMSFSMDRQADLSQQFDTSLKHLSQQTSSSFLIAPKID